MTEPNPRCSGSGRPVEGGVPYGRVACPECGTNCSVTPARLRVHDHYAPSAIDRKNTNNGTPEWLLLDGDISAVSLIDWHIKKACVSATGVEWLMRVRTLLLKRFEAQLTGKRQRITTEQAALAMLKGASLELEAAGKALDTAAEQLRDAGQGKQASQAKQAASQAKAAAGELVPS